jgi:hypothetical protein
MFNRKGLQGLEGTAWTGTAETWKDPLGNEVDECNCILEINQPANEVKYRWEHQGKEQEGRIAIKPEGGATFMDSMHTNNSPLVLAELPNSRSMFCFEGPYNDVWGWRVLLTMRATDPSTHGDLVMQMVNIAPWGEVSRK